MFKGYERTRHLSSGACRDCQDAPFHFGNRHNNRLTPFLAQEPQALVVDSTPSPNQHHAMLGEPQNHFQLDERRRGD
jgi:hypothetical protein